MATFSHSIGPEPYPDGYASVTSYAIHDNMGSPYRIEVDSKAKTLKVFMQRPSTTDEESKTTSEQLLKQHRYSHIWPGIDTEKPQWTGNTILFRDQETNKLIWIGNDGVQQLLLPDDEEILILFSAIGNNDVPYAYAIGTKNTYLLSEAQYIPTRAVSIDQLLGRDKLYDDYYAGSFRTTSKCMTKGRMMRVLASRECPWDLSCKPW